MILINMKDRYYGFVAGFILGDTKLATKKRGYSDNVAIFLCIMECFTRSEVSPFIILQEIEKCYSEKAGYKYASAISHNTIKPSLAIALRRFQTSGEILPSQNMEMSGDVIFRAMAPALMQRFKNYSYDEIVIITHGAPMIKYYLAFITDFCKLIFDGAPKKTLQKFASGRGYSEEIISLPGIPSNEIGETIRQALHLFFINDGVIINNSVGIPNGLYGMFAGGHYGFKYLHENNLVKIDAEIMDLIGKSYSD